MSHELSLALELLDQTARGLLFRMTVENRSSVKLFLPYPEITGLKFGDTTTMLQAEWYTSVLVSAAGGGFALQPSESRSIEWAVRPCNVERPAGDDLSDYSRWSVELPTGEYLVWFQWNVGHEYFDPDSHTRLPDLERLAEDEGAVVWLGQVVSNRLKVLRT